MIQPFIKPRLVRIYLEDTSVRDYIDAALIVHDTSDSYGEYYTFICAVDSNGTVLGNITMLSGDIACMGDIDIIITPESMYNAIIGGEPHD